MPLLQVSYDMQILKNFNCSAIDMLHEHVPEKSLLSLSLFPMHSSFKYILCVLSLYEHQWQVQGNKAALPEHLQMKNLHCCLSNWQLGRCHWQGELTANVNCPLLPWQRSSLLLGYEIFPAGIFPLAPQQPLQSMILGKDSFLHTCFYNVQPRKASFHTAFPRVH